MSDSPTQEQRRFWQFEREGWQAVARGYHDHFASLTTQALPAMLDAVRAVSGVRLLDVCTGPGYAAAAAAERGGWATGLDFSIPMIRQARIANPGLEFLVGDAEQLPFVSASVDAVITNFGILHLARPESFLAEANRVLRPGGRVGFTVWAPPAEAVVFSIVLGVVEAYGNASAPLPAGPPFFRFSDADECRRTLKAAGFSGVEVMKVHQTWRFDDPDMLFEAINSGTVRTGGLLRAQDPAALSRIRAAMRTAVEGYRNADIYEVPAPAVLAAAVKP